MIKRKHILSKKKEKMCFLFFAFWRVLMKKMRMYFLTFSCFFFKVLNRSQKNGILPGKRA